MSTTITAVSTQSPVSKSIILDILALTFIYFIPALSHIGNVPLYLVEPMRIMIIIAIAHTSHRNAYIIALTLPLFSFIVTDHPVFYKTLIMTAELLVNIWLFYFLSKKWKNNFTAMFVSIFISKLFYYLLKFGLMSFLLIESDLITIPIYLQVITMVLFSAYLFIVLSRKGTCSPVFVDPTNEEF